MNLLDKCIYAVMSPYYFYKSLLYFKKQYYPIMTPNARLREAQHRIYNQLTELLIEECPLVSLDLGGTLLKLCLFIPESRVCNFKVHSFYLPFFQPQNSFMSSVMHGRFLFFYFQQNYIGLVINFLNEHGFPHSYKKELRCTGGGAIRYKQLLLEKTHFTTIYQHDEMMCLHRGLLFLTSLKLRNEVYAVRQSGPVNEKLENQTHPFDVIQLFEASESPEINSIFDRYRWFGYTQSLRLQRVQVRSNWLFPCLLCQIGSGISMLRLTETEQARVDGGAVGGSVWLNLGKIVTGSDFDALLRAGKYGAASRLSLNNAALGLCSRLPGSPKSEDFVAGVTTMIAQNTAEIAVLNARQHGLKRIVFSGGFVANQPAAHEAMQDACERANCEALFLQHDAVIGSIGALLGQEHEWKRVQIAYEEVETLLREIDEREESEVVSVGPESFY